MEKGYAVIYLDVMMEGRFYKQLPYRYQPLFKVKIQDVVKHILQELPSLKEKKWDFSFSKCRVFK